MLFDYSKSSKDQDETDGLARVPLLLHREGVQAIETIGLVDSGSAVNVLPFDVGLKLDSIWDDRKAIIRLSGNLGPVPTMPVFLFAKIGDLPAIRLAFARAKSSNVPLILGQTNFFMEFDVCFFRSQFTFEIKPRQSL